MNGKGQTDKDKERTGTGKPEGKFVGFGGSGRRRSGGVSACVRKLERQRHGKARREEKTDRHTTVRAEREARTNDMADTVVVVGRARVRVVQSLSLELL